MNFLYIEPYKIAKVKSYSQIFIGIRADYGKRLSYPVDFMSFETAVCQKPAYSPDFTLPLTGSKRTTALPGDDIRAGCLILRMANVSRFFSGTRIPR